MTLFDADDEEIAQGPFFHAIRGEENWKKTMALMQNMSTKNNTGGWQMDGDEGNSFTNGMPKPKIPETANTEVLDSGTTILPVSEYWYRATPGTCPARWDNVHQHHNKQIFKMLAHYLRRICDRRPTQMEDALADIQQQAPGTTEEQLEVILTCDPGRFAKSFVNGKYMLCANSRHNGVYRCYPADLDSAMDQRHLTGNVHPHRVPLNVVYDTEPGRQTIYHHWT